MQRRARKEGRQASLFKAYSFGSLPLNEAFKVPDQGGQEGRGGHKSQRRARKEGRQAPLLKAWFFWTPVFG
jgi:hypothetical protein